MIPFDEHIFQMGWFNHQLDQLVQSKKKVATANMPSFGMSLPSSNYDSEVVDLLLLFFTMSVVPTYVRSGRSTPMISI